MNLHEQHMQLAVDAAKKSLPEDVPVGAVIVNTSTNEIICASSNERERNQTATHHAEILAIEKACEVLKMRRLNDYTMYVTLEPCVMCAGALVQSHIGEVIFGAFDPQYGAAGSIYNFFSDPRLSHNAPVTGGVLSDVCSKLMTDFFDAKR